MIVLDKSSAGSNTHDTPSEFLPADPTALHHLSEQQLETIFFQARANDGCYISIVFCEFSSAYSRRTKS
jgi:hypothetical protein